MPGEMEGEGWWPPDEDVESDMDDWETDWSAVEGSDRDSETPPDYAESDASESDAEENVKSEDTTEDDDETSEDSEDFEDAIRELEQFNERNKRWAHEELDDYRVETFLRHTCIDLDAVRSAIKSFVRYRRGEYEKIRAMPPDHASTWMLAEKVHEKEMALRHKLTLMAAGITSDVLSNLMDDYTHLQEDAFDPEARELRKRLKEKMSQLSHSERKEFLLRELKTGTITESLYSTLCEEFL